MQSMSVKQKYSRLSTEQRQLVGDAWDEFYLRVEDTFDSADEDRGVRLIDHPDLEHFMSIAALCDHRGWVVRDYVRVAYDLLSNGVKPVLPAELRDISTQMEYSKNLVLRMASSAADLAWMQQEQQFKRMRASELFYPDDVSALIKGFAPFDAWFRVMYLEPLHPKLDRIYGTQAHAMIMSDPELHRMLKRRRPEVLHALVSEHGALSVEGI